MRWEVQYPEPKQPAPYDIWDTIVCVGFAYGFTMALIDFNIVLYVIIELCWVWFCKERLKNER